MEVDGRFLQQVLRSVTKMNRALGVIAIPHQFVLLTEEGGRALLTTAAADVQLRVQLPGSAAQAEAAFVPLGMRLPPARVEMTQDPGESPPLVRVAGGIRLAVPTLPLDDRVAHYRWGGATGEMHVDLAALLGAVERVSACAAPRETARPPLQGVAVLDSGVIATDGYWVAHDTALAADDLQALAGRVLPCAPLAALQPLVAMLTAGRGPLPSRVSLEASSGRIYLHLVSPTLALRVALIEGRYPDVFRVLPRGYDGPEATHWTLPAAEMRRVIPRGKGRMLPVARLRVHGDTVEVEIDEEGGAQSITLPVRVRGRGDVDRVALDARKLARVLAAYGQEMQLDLLPDGRHEGYTESVVRVRSDTATFWIMPLEDQRLQEDTVAATAP